MATPLGAHSPILDAAVGLRKKSERRARGLFLFEGPTLLGDALECDLPLERIFVSESALGKSAEAIERAEQRGTPVHVVGDRSLARLSDVESPAGIVAVARAALSRAADILHAPGVVLLLAGVSDPGNAGTLMRAAEAFGIERILFGTGSVEPYHPKVVRAAMGSLFRLAVAPTAAADLRAAAAAWQILGLRAGAPSLEGVEAGPRCLLAIGHERQGLGEFEPLCTAFAGIPMRGRAESLNAAVAGSIALYDLSKRSRP